MTVEQGPLVIGLTGPNAAGKGEIARLLGERGYRSVSLSDVVREEARRRGLPPEREHLIRIGNELRREGGAGVLAERILERLDHDSVVDSIRSPAEVAVLRQGLRRFVLIGVDAAPRLRFTRSLERRRPGDPASFEEFEMRERQENSGDPAAQQLSATLALADHRLTNDGSLGELGAALSDLLERLEE